MGRHGHRPYLLIRTGSQFTQDPSHLPLLAPEFRPVLERWVDLVQGIDSAEALADRYWEEVYSKVDVSQYGL